MVILQNADSVMFGQCRCHGKSKLAASALAQVFLPSMPCSHRCEPCCGYPVYDNATAYRDAPGSDIFLTGFPCQPFSNSGVGGALSDDRGCVILHIIMYLKRAMPRIFILENVPGRLTHHGEVFAATLEQLKALKDRFGDRYFVSWRLLNSMRHGGVPQNRERIYIVGIKRCHRRLTFSWPDEIPCIPLSDMWDTDRVALRTYRRYPFPTLVVPEKCVMNAMSKILNKAEEDG